MQCYLNEWNENEKRETKNEKRNEMKTFITKMNSMNECGKGNAKEKNEEAKKKSKRRGKNSARIRKPIENRTIQFDLITI